MNVFAFYINVAVMMIFLNSDIVTGNLNWVVVDNLKNAMSLGSMFRLNFSTQL